MTEAPFQFVEADLALVDQDANGSNISYASGSLTWVSGGSSTAFNGIATSKVALGTNPGNFEAEVTMNAPTSGSGSSVRGGPAARTLNVLGTIRGYFVREATQGQPGVWELVKFDGTTVTTLGTLDVSSSVTAYGVSMKLTAIGSTLWLKAWASGSSEPSWASATNVLKVTDSTYTTGQVAIGAWGQTQTSDKVAWSGLKCRPVNQAIVRSAGSTSDTASNTNSYTVSVSAKAYEPMWLFVYNQVGSGTAPTPTITAPSGVTVSSALTNATFAGSSLRRVGIYTAMSTSDLSSATFTFDFSNNQTGFMAHFAKVWGGDPTSSNGSSSFGNATDNNYKFDDPNTSASSITGSTLTFSNPYGTSPTILSAANNLNDAFTPESGWTELYDTAYGSPTATGTTGYYFGNDTTPSVSFGSSTAQRVIAAAEVKISPWGTEEYNVSPDTGAGVDAVSALAADPSNGDTGSAAESESVEVIGGAVDKSDSDTATGTDAVSELAITATQDDSGSGADAVSTLAAAATEGDTGSGTDDSTAVISASSDDPATGTDTDSALVVAASNDEPGAVAEVASIAIDATVDDTATSADAESALVVAATDADTGSSVEAESVAVAFADSDAGTATDDGTIVQYLSFSSDDTGAATDDQWVVVAASDADTAVATDAGSVVEYLPVSDGDTGSAVDAGAVVEFLSYADGETAAADDAGSIAITATVDEPVAGADAGTAIASLSDDDTGTATEAESVFAGVEVSSTDVAAGVDDQQLAAVVDGSDSGAVLEDQTVALSLADDAGAATDAASVLVALSDDDTGSGADAGTVAVAGVSLSDDDAALGSDDQSVLVLVSDEDAVGATDSQSLALALTDGDTGTGADAAALTIPVADDDQIGTVDGQSLVVALANDDLADLLDTAVLVLLGDAEVGTFTETESAYDASVQVDKWVVGQAQSAWKLRDADAERLLREALGAQLATEVVGSWSIGEVCSPWTIGRLGEENQLGIMEISQYSAQYVRVPVEAILAGVPVNVSSYSVQIALTALDDDDPTQDWGAATWEVDTSTDPTTYYARKVVGPLAPGAYKVWVKVSAGPETPVLKVPSELIVR